MELLQLRYFQTIAQYESITAAARHYRIPQASMSQTLARLEKDLGNIRLFDRKNNHIFLNENGRRFLSHVNQALAALDSGVEALKAADDQISGQIRLLVMENSRFIIQCISRFVALYPDVNFVICHDFYSDQDADYDLCIAAHPFYKEMRASLPLIREQLVLALCREHPLAGYSEIALSELKNEKFITMTARSSLFNTTVEKCRECGFEPRIAISCDDPYYIRKYISENMGVAIAPPISWAGRFRENTCLIPIVDPPIDSTSYLVWNDRIYLSPAVQAFRSFLKAEAGKVTGNLITG